MVHSFPSGRHVPWTVAICKNKPAALPENYLFIADRFWIIYAAE
jgi:hypothetical protein